MLKKINTITVCLLLILSGLTIQPIVLTNASKINSSDLIIDLYTQKTPYNGKGLNQTGDAFAPQETVILYANATYNKSPLQSVYVSFQVFGPINAIKNFTFTSSSKTNGSGIASWVFTIPWPCENAETIVFGVWTALASVKIYGETVQDKLTFKVDWIVQIVSLETIDGDFQPRSRFGTGGDVGVKLVLKNIAMTSKTTTLSFLIRDELNVPVAFDEIDNFQVQPNAPLIHIFFKLEIPKWAYVGNALLEACVFTAAGNKTPYSPSEYKNLTITREHPLEIMLDDIAVK
ncbi:MAG: hypothetical protein U9O89_04180, partial [Thermoproteota archaeon]|nr:hypothetical protein [Thermoproteota archaeon]